MKKLNKIRLLFLPVLLLPLFPYSKQAKPIGNKAINISSTNITIEKSYIIYYSNSVKAIERYDDKDIEYLAKCIMSEAGNQDEYGKRLVIDVILNRLEDDNFPDTIKSIINQPGQFEVVQNGAIESIAPTNDIYTLIEEELENRTNEEVLYFRTNYYHSFGTPVLVHQDHYFSK